MAASPAPSRPQGGHGSTTEFLLGIIPTSLFSALTSGEVLQTLLVALLVGFALQAMGAAGQPVLRGVGHLQRLVFRVLAMIMWAAPIGAFGAIAAVVGETGVDALKSLAVLMIGFYVTCALFVFVVLGTAAQADDRRQHLLAAALPRPRVPADPLDLVLGVGAAAADRQDGARRRRQADRRCRRADRLLVQPRRHRDLPDHGLAVHRRRRMGDPLSIGEQISLLLFMMIASKGAAGVTGAGMATLAGGLSSHRPSWSTASA